MKQLYVIGDPVAHSLSPVMHNAAFKELGIHHEYRYDTLPIKRDELPSFIESLRTKKIYGASVTIPHKESILPYIDRLTDEASLIKAVNTIYQKDDMINGHNTDGIGCIKTFYDHHISLKGKQVLIIGAGGAAKAITYSLLKNDVGIIYLFNRTMEKAIKLSQDIKETLEKDIIVEHLDAISTYVSDVDIVIQTTSVGMKGSNEHQRLIAPSLLHSELIVFDIIYNPQKTMLLHDAEKKGATIINGVDMLVHQGAEQFTLFTEKQAPVSVMKTAVKEALK